jgi:hypothetical protein
MSAGKSPADIAAHMIALLRPRPADDAGAADVPDERLIAVRRGRPLLDQHGTERVSLDGLGPLADAVEQRRKTTRRLAE